MKLWNKIALFLCLLGFSSWQVACLACEGGSVHPLAVCVSFKNKAGQVIEPDTVTYVDNSTASTITASPDTDDKYCFNLLNSATTVTATWQGETLSKEVSEPKYNMCQAGAKIDTSFSFSN